ncbi:MAG: glycosyltransferase family 4 protein [Armatimonadetes bacterium]|nr:glycosyltransferase family 4 protein [Armatimonadota bacterium]
MRIAIWYNFLSGGAKRALYHQVKGLAKRGHHVESWCTPQSQDGYLPFSEIVQSEHVIPVKDWSSPLGRLSWRIEARRRSRAIDEHCRICAGEIDTGGFDVVLVNACAYTVVSQIGRYLKTPNALYLPEPRRWLYEAVLQMGQSVKMQKIPFLRPIAAYMRQMERDEERELAGYYDSILVNSLYSRESLLRAYGLESRVCYLGVDASLFSPIEVEKGNYVVGLGEIDERKGVDRALRAVAAVEKTKRPQLVWIGNRANQSYQAHIESLAESLDVDFAPKLMIGDEELLEILSGAIAMIYTSRLEPFGLAPLEASACCTPVVAIAEGGVRETVLDGVNGLLATHVDPALIAALISKLIDEPEYARSLGVQGRQLVIDKWNWEQATSNIESCLQALL